MNYATATTCSPFKALGPFRIVSSGSDVYSHDVTITYDRHGNQKLVQRGQLPKPEPDPKLELDLGSVFEDLYDVRVAKTVLGEQGEDVPLEQIRKELGLD